MQNPFSLVGKKVLITGASEGIGKSVAVQCAVQGALVSLTARNEKKLEITKNLLNENEHQVVPADLNNDGDILTLADRLPLLDGLVLNAGMIKTVPVKFIKRDVLQEMFNVNIQSSMLLIQHLLKQKKINKGASICFISSVASNYVHLGNSVYSATKGAVNSFAKALALELAPKKIRVNAILPGFVETGILNNGAIGSEQLEEHMKNYPLGRYGKPEDIAYLVQYLLSDASVWMTGSLLTIDGGYSIK
jgi:NAD(P)-dependent dehydrogenase (short-subunit alcohol dehydrogenase family)